MASIPPSASPSPPSPSQPAVLPLSSFEAAYQNTDLQSAYLDLAGPEAARIHRRHDQEIALAARAGQEAEATTKLMCVMVVFFKIGSASRSRGPERPRSPEHILQCVMRGGSWERHFFISLARLLGLVLPPLPRPARPVWTPSAVRRVLRSYTPASEVPAGEEAEFETQREPETDSCSD